MSQNIPEKQRGEAATPICGAPKVIIFLTPPLRSHLSTTYLAMSPP